MRAVVTVSGTDRRGVIAKVSTLLDERNCNIEDISQTILGGQFAMVMIVRCEEENPDFTALAEALDELGRSIGMNVRIQHAEIFDAMHNV